MTSTLILSPFVIFVSSLRRKCLMVDMMNNRFLELGAILEPGRPPKTDKAAILIDAVRMVNQLRGEAQKLKDSNSNLQEKIKELKVSLRKFFNQLIEVETSLLVISLLLCLLAQKLLNVLSRKP